MAKQLNRTSDHRHTIRSEIIPTRLRICRAPSILLAHKDIEFGFHASLLSQLPSCLVSYRTTLFALL